MLCLQLLLGLRPDREARSLVSDAPAGSPAWAGDLELNGVRAFDRVWNATARVDGPVVVEEG